MNITILDQHLDGAAFEQVRAFDREATSFVFVSGGGMILLLARGQEAEYVRKRLSGQEGAAPALPEPKIGAGRPKRKPGWPGGDHAPTVAVTTGPESSEPTTILNETTPDIVES